MTYLGAKVFGNFRPSRSDRNKRTEKARDRREGEDKSYRAKLRELPCVICGAPAPNTVHHLKATGQRGMGMRSPDKFGLPLCMVGFTVGGHDCHGQVERAGSKNELKWFQKRGIDAVELCYALWGVKHSVEAMERVLLAHKGVTP